MIKIILFVGIGTLLSIVLFLWSFGYIDLIREIRRVIGFYRKRQENRAVNKLVGSIIDGKVKLVDLSNRNLTDINFKAITIERVNFCKSTIADCYFGRASLLSCNFRNADLTNVSFRSTRFSAVGFSGATIRNSLFCGLYFEYSDLTYIDCRSCTFDSADLSRSNLSESLFSGSTFRRSRLYKADLRNVYMRFCDIGNTTFIGANMVGSTFEQCSFDNARFNKAIFYETEKVIIAYGRWLVFNKLGILDVVNSYKGNITSGIIDHKLELYSTKALSDLFKTED